MDLVFVSDTVNNEHFVEVFYEDGRVRRYYDTELEYDCLLKYNYVKEYYEINN